MTTAGDKIEVKICRSREELLINLSLGIGSGEGVSKKRRYRSICSGGVPT